MRYLIIILLSFPLTCTAQGSTYVDNISQQRRADSIQTVLISGKLDSSARGDISAGTKTIVTTKRGSARADTFSIPANGIVNLQPWLATNGFTSMLIVGAIPWSSDTSSNASASLHIRDWTPTTVTLRVKVQNAAVVSILGINVLSGLPLITPAVGVVKAYLSFVAYQ